MNTTHRNLFVAASAVTVGAVTFHQSMQQQLIDAYPLRDPKLVKKAYNQMTRDAFRGKFLGVDVTNEFLNAYFDIKYNNLTK